MKPYLAARLAILLPNAYACWSRQRPVHMETGRTAMNIFHILIAIAWLLVAEMAIIGNTALAQAQQDYCVSCSGPDETYVCRVSTKAGSATGQQFFCIVNIAQQYGHDSCKAATSAQSCQGVLVQYEISAPSGAPVPSQQARLAPQPPSPQDKPKKPGGEPRTLVEFTKQATKATQKELKSLGSNTKKALDKTGNFLEKTGKNIAKTTEKIGKGIGSATQTTLKCVASLFTRCSGQ